MFEFFILGEKLGYHKDPGDKGVSKKAVILKEAYTGESVSPGGGGPYPTDPYYTKNKPTTKPTTKPPSTQGGKRSSGPVISASIVLSTIAFFLTRFS